MKMVGLGGETAVIKHGARIQSRESEMPHAVSLCRTRLADSFARSAVLHWIKSLAIPPSFRANNSPIKHLSSFSANFSPGGDQMNFRISKGRGRRARRLTLALMTAAVVGGAVTSAQSDGGLFPFPVFFSGNLVVSRSVYDNNPNNVTVGETLPPNCASTTGGCSPGATNNGTYPAVWNNALSDGSFGITSTIFLDQITPWGWLVNSLEVPNSSQKGITTVSDQLVTSFSSKSELALNLSSDHNYLTFMDYVAPVDALDVSNSNTPGEVDPTNPVGENNFRAVAQVDQWGKFHFTETNAYSGNNGRAAILNSSWDTNVFYTAGNAGNGSNPQPDGIIIGAGAQILTPEY